MYLEHTHTVYIQCLCMYISNHTCMFPHLCALTHFPPLPPMTTCGVIQVHQVRIFRELHMYTYTVFHPKHNPSATHHLTPFNTLSYIPAYTYTLLCDTIPSLFSLKNTCGSAYFLPCRQGNPGPAGKPVQDNSTTHLLQSLSEKGCVTVTRSLSFPMNTCGVAYVTRAS